MPNPSWPVSTTANDQPDVGVPNAASGSPIVIVLLVCDAATNAVPRELPEAAFGTPTSGWSFAVVLTGQDGFGTDQARNFTPTPGAFTFGVCATGNNDPICSVDPGTVPKAVDVITPPGVSQATELNPTLGPVVIQGVAVP